MTRFDGRVERGNRTRQLMLRRTIDIVSVEGSARLLGRSPEDWPLRG